MTKRPEPPEALRAAIKASCWSCHDGCACGLDRGHTGLHQCAAASCGHTWDDDQARAWEAEIYREGRDYS